MKYDPAPMSVNLFTESTSRLGGESLKPKVYIASPYTIGDNALNVRASLEAAEKLIALGYVPYAPLLTHFWHMMFPHEPEYWYEYDLHWVDACDALLRLPGKSHGADREVEHACARRIPCFDSIEALCLEIPTTKQNVQLRDHITMPKDILRQVLSHTASISNLVYDAGDRYGKEQ